MAASVRIPAVRTTVIRSGARSAPAALNPFLTPSARVSSPRPIMSWNAGKALLESASAVQAEFEERSRRLKLTERELRLSEEALNLARRGEVPRTHRRYLESRLAHREALSSFEQAAQKLRAVNHRLKATGLTDVLLPGHQGQPLVVMA